MHNEPDRQEKGTRFGCGALVGVPLGISLAMDWLRNDSMPAGVLVVIASAVLIGFLAMRYGDYFWEKILPRIVRWW